MELKEFISSGVLESYVLGTASAEEIRQVIEMEKLYPELKAEIEAIEESMMRYAEADVIPSDKLKEKIEGRVFEKKQVPKKQATVVNIRSLNTSSIKYLRFAVAASVGLLIGVSYFTYTLYEKINKAQFELSSLRAENAVLAEEIGIQQMELYDNRTQLSIIQQPETKVVSLAGVSSAPDASAKLLWNPEEKKLYINAASLPMPPEGKQYQLWAIVNGKPVDAGVFTMPHGDFVMQKMKVITEAEAFAVTLEKEGGSESPTMDAMLVMGKV
ncbi:MAG: anti-sigma factor [Bacteroidetes bacterium]|nr:anti-sigma factor [Bacteroidota bacterium]